VYGYGVFVLAPFFVGMAAGFQLNRVSDAGAGYTFTVAMAGLALGSVSLAISAMEGLICIAMAAPLGVPPAFLGAWLGRTAALRTNPSRMNTFAGLLLLPFVFLAERAADDAAQFTLRSSVEIAAPVETAWSSLVDFAPIDETPPLAFRRGLAYPIDATLHDHGVGAARTGHFSTGAALERITDWVPNRTLAFEVLTEPPSMRELSPYGEIEPPHVHGFFSTRSTRFDLQPTATGTRLTVESAHTLRLGPLPYWLPMARWAAGENHSRVLRHIAGRAESAAAAAAHGEHPIEEPGR
jgi:hypothetical protein